MFENVEKYLDIVMFYLEMFENFQGFFGRRS